MPPKKGKLKGIRTPKKSGDRGSSRSSSSLGEQPGGADLQVNIPPKRGKLNDIRRYLMKSGDPGSSRSSSSLSEQPGGAEGSEPGGAEGSEPGGAEVSKPGGAKGSEPGGAEGSEPGGAEGSEPGGAEVSEPGGAEGSEPGGADLQTGAYNEVKVKKEKNGESEDRHSHCFTVKFRKTDLKEYSIDCDRPRTVLQAVKSSENYNEIIKCSDQQIMFQVGKGQECIVATHFPCSCISDNECLILSHDKSNVEETQSYYDQTVQPRHNYSVFYIDTRDWLRTKHKVFRNKAVKNFPLLCVYGEKEMTVEEALKRDGRFHDELGDFHLSDYDNSNIIFGRTHKVRKLDKKKYRIHLKKNKSANDDKQQEKAGTSDSAQQSCDPILDAGKQRGISVRKALEKSSCDVDPEKIYEILRQQFPGLKELMEKRFTADSYQKLLNQRKENKFGKIQQSFSEVHKLKRMLKLGESVCKVVVKGFCEGTGFVLFDNYILTNGHLFQDCITEGRLQPDIDVSVFFNYEKPEPDTNYYYFKLADSYIWYYEDDLDYAVLKINAEGQKPNQTTQTKIMKVPPGLLKNFGPRPRNGVSCIIGHPAGGLKKIDPICIIEKNRRKQAVNDHISKYKDCDFIVHKIINSIQNQGIYNIMVGGHRADKVLTYDTFMYHGSSGSPVFDAQGRVFGLHTAGFTYELNNKEESVIEFAQPLPTILKHFVSKMEERGAVDLLKIVKKEAERNKYLKTVLELQTADTEEPADTEELSDFTESMEVD